MNIANKPLLATFCLALLSLTAYQAVVLIDQKNSTVLGETITNFKPSAPSQTSNGIPCSVINNLQKQYCTGTLYPTPTPIDIVLPPAF